MKLNIWQWYHYEACEVYLVVVLLYIIGTKLPFYNIGQRNLSMAGYNFKIQRIKSVFKFSHLFILKKQGKFNTREAIQNNSEEFVASRISEFFKGI